MIIKQLSDINKNQNLSLGIFLASFLTLFFELLLIRYQSSIVPIFVYFKNVALLSCFLGLGIGFSLGNSNKNRLPIAAFLIVFQYLLLFGLRYFIPDVLTLNPIAQAIYACLSLGVVFIIFATSCIPLGQYASYLMSLKQPLVSYSINLLGSLSAIVLFSFLSFLSTPPLIWYTVTFAIIFWFLRKSQKLLYLTIFLFLFILTGEGIIKPWILKKKNIIEIYSPYNRIVANFQNNFPYKLRLTTNNYFSQVTHDLSKEARSKYKTLENIKSFEFESIYYDTPYKVKSDIESILVVGSGTGNDVASALRANVKSIDAVEIDPKIVELGKQFHPEKPYNDPRVTLYINDARNYIKNCKKKYDLIVFGGLDSQSTLSSISNVRLENFTYTTEALREAKKLLKKEGIIFLSFSPGRENLLGKKFIRLLQTVFDGKRPLCYKRDTIDWSICLISNGSLKFPPLNSLSLSKVKAIDLTNVLYDPKSSFDLPSDDWPFYYMIRRHYPLNYLVVISTLLLTSFFLIKTFFVNWRKNFNPQFFFLGAGFMLIETKGITELGVEFGNTWYVVAIIISAILILAFLANLVVIKLKNINTKACYMFLLGVILLEAVFWVSSKLTFLPLAIIPYLKLIILTLPIFFSGLIFSNELKRRNNISSVFSSNLLGSMCGGFLEYTALYTGYHALAWFALVIYFLAFASHSKGFIRL